MKPNNYSLIWRPPLRIIHDEQIKMRMTFVFIQKDVSLLSVTKFHDVYANVS